MKESRSGSRRRRWLPPSHDAPRLHRKVLKIHEVTTTSGELAPVGLEVREGTLLFVTGDEAYPLALEVLDAVMRRFGGALDPDASLREVGRLTFGEGGGFRVVRHVRHLAHYDVIARDFLVHESPSQPPLCALATTVAGALDHLCRARGQRTTNLATWQPNKPDSS